MDTDYWGALLDGVATGPDASDLFYGAGIVIYRETPHGQVYCNGGCIPS